MHYGGRTDVDMTHMLLESIAKLECTESKLALARTCKAWHKTLWHPAFWTTYQLPHFSSNGALKRFLERQVQRFQRTTCFWVSRPTNAVSMNESSILLLFHMAPALRELVVYSTHPALGDSFVRLMARAGQDVEHPSYAPPNAPPRQNVRRRLKRLTFRRVWLSNKSFVQFLGHTIPHAGWAESLEDITFFNVPPVHQRRETATQIIFSPKPLELSTCELMQKLGPQLSSMRLHNPDTGATCVLDVEGGRAGLDPFDRGAYHAYACGLPEPPKVPVDAGRRWPGLHEQNHPDAKMIIGANRNFILELPAAKAEAGPSSSSGASTSAAPDLQPPEAKTARGPRAGPSLQGRRMLVPHLIWPDYACTENGGAGWAATIMSVCSGGVVRVQFESATDEEGRPYPDEHLKLEDLRPLEA